VQRIHGPFSIERFTGGAKVALIIVRNIIAPKSWIVNPLSLVFLFHIKQSHGDRSRLGYFDKCKRCILSDYAFDAQIGENFFNPLNVRFVYSPIPMNNQIFR
jgi:hypothetical protein